jgi:hypothetical protein
LPVRKPHVVSFRTLCPKNLAKNFSQPHNAGMRGLLSLVIVAGICAGVYWAYFKRMPTTDSGTAPTQAISLTGVRSDLLQIAQAERAYVATNSKCVSLNELISSGSMTMSSTSREGYSYAVECSGAEFTVTARHAPAPADSPIRYPNFAIDQNMQVHEVN